MLISMRKGLFFLVFGFFFQESLVLAQGNIFNQVDGFVSDATFYSEKFISPSVDAAIYQSSSSWMNTPKKNEFGKVTLGLHGNYFVVPKKDRFFTVNQSDLSFFQLQNGQSSVEVPTALGGEVDYSFAGDLGGIPLSISAPQGINQEYVLYPFLQGSVALWKGFELVGRYSTKVKLKKGDYQVYGFGLKHNFSQYINFLEKKNIHFAILLANSYENVNLDFITNNAQFISDLGVGTISGRVKTWQFQMSASKEWEKFELVLSSITNISGTRYFISGDGNFNQVLPIQDFLNEQLSKQDATKINAIGELSGRYKINDFYIQSSVAFGKFVNANLSVQYEFNLK